MKRIMPLLATLRILAACGSGDVDLESTAPGVSFQPGDGDAVTISSEGPVAIAYRIIGTPIVDQPLGIDLQITSKVGAEQITIDYRVNDSTAMEFGEAQPASVTIAASNDGGPSLQQVRVVPLREGRVFLNVSASVQTDNGTRSTVIAIPIQVAGTSRPE